MIVRLGKGLRRYSVERDEARHIVARQVTDVVERRRVGQRVKGARLRAIHPHFTVIAQIFGVNRVVRGIVVRLAAIFVGPAMHAEFGVGRRAARGAGKPQLDRARADRSARGHHRLHPLPPDRAREDQIGLLVEAAGAIDHLEPPQPRKGGEHRRELARARRGDVARHANRRCVDDRKRPEPRLRMAQRRKRGGGGIAPRRGELGIVGQRLVIQQCGVLVDSVRARVVALVIGPRRHRRRDRHDLLCVRRRERQHRRQSGDDQRAKKGGRRTHGPAFARAR